jgi:ParB-like chromosome segregation protein Spo0J
MNLRIKQLPLTALTPYEKNANIHPENQIKQIADSITKYGFNNPILIDKDGGIIAGHGRYEAAMRLKLEKVPTVCLDHLTPEQKRQYIIADNKLAEGSYWDEDVLAMELSDMDVDFSVMGFEEGEGETLIAENIETISDTKGEEETKGELLELASVTLGEPVHEVHHGQRWRLGDKHDLLILSVISESLEWRQFLRESTLFCPYPNPLTALSIKGDAHHLLLVQPDRYIAGHILDQYETIHGAGSVVLV